MTEIQFNVRRLIIALAVSGIGLIGLTTAPAYASGTSDGKKGEIEVCKKVLGPGDHLEFKFVIEKKDGQIVKKFTLEKNECKTVDVDAGKFKIREHLPKGCEVKMIHVKGEDNRNIKDPEKARVWVEVKKGESVKVTFFDKCKKDDHKDHEDDHKDGHED